MAALDGHFSPRSRRARKWLVCLGTLCATFCATPKACAQDFEDCSSPESEIVPGIELVESVELIESFAIGELQVDLRATFSENREFSIESPAGTSVTLLSASGSYFPNRAMNVTYSDYGSLLYLWYSEGTLALHPRGPIKPSGPGALADFRGELSDGNWTLTIADPSSYGGYFGVLHEWCVRGYVTARAEEVACSPTDNIGEISVSWVNGGDFDEVEVHVNGAYWSSLFADLGIGESETYLISSLPVPQVAQISIVPRTDDGGPTLFPARCSVPLTAIPVVELELFPDAVISPLLAPNFVLFDFVEDLILEDLQVALRLDFPALSGLEVNMSSPAGTSVTLHEKFGYEPVDGEDDDLLDLTYWDLGIPNAMPHDCACLMQPTGPGMLADYAGESLSGTWIIVVSQVYSPSVSYEGTLERASIRAFDVAAAFAARDLGCARGTSNDTIVATWTNGAAYDSIYVYVNHSLESVLSGPFAADESLTYTTLPLPAPSLVEIGVVGVLGDAPGLSADCTKWLPVIPTIVECAPADLEIPDDGATYASTLSIVGTLTLNDVDVSVDISTTFVGSLDCSLVSPMAKELLLYNGMGTNQDDIRLIFDDDGTPLDVDLLTCDCPMRPSGPGRLDDFANEIASGDWTLELSTFTDPGTLNEWCLRLFGCSIMPPTALICEWDGSSVLLSWKNGAPYDGIEIVRNGEAIAAIAADATQYEDAPLPGWQFYQVRGVSASLACAAGTPACRVATDVIERCSDAKSFGTLSLGDSVQLTIDEEITIDWIEVLFDAVALSPGSRDFLLRSPYGTEVALHSLGNPGHFELVWSDFGAVNTGFGANLDCGFCRIRPPSQAPLSAFIGETAAGEWTLFTDNSSGPTQIEEWCLGIHVGCTAAAPQFTACGPGADAIVLEWTLPEAYDQIEVLRDGFLQATLAGTDDAYVDVEVSGGFHVYQVFATVESVGCVAKSPPCETALDFRFACKDDTEVALEDDGTESDAVEFVGPEIIATLEAMIDIRNTNQYAWTLFLESPQGTEVWLHAGDGHFGDLQIIWSDAGEPNTGYYDSYDCYFCKIQPIGPGTFADFEAKRPRENGSSSRPPPHR